tara:strand:+ start:150 stop:788 length:639 start_codon:yes stop_codon:yes gene_type:complete
MKWVAFFSQSGSEIASLCYENREDLIARGIGTGGWPDVIITDNTDIVNWDPSMRDLYDPLCIEPNKKRPIFHVIHDKSKCKCVSDLSELIGGSDSGEIIVTLHGWLHIVPSLVCHVFDIYNGHPGMISRYPELKGKDPQQKVIDRSMHYSWIGSVVHKVIPEVDGGQILFEENCKRSIIDRLFRKNVVFDQLRETSFKCWTKFFKSFPKEPT